MRSSRQIFARLKNPLVAKISIGVLLAAALVGYCVLAVTKHNTYNSSGYDLGIQDQVIWHYSRFEAPRSTVMGFDNALGDHFSPIQVFAAPALWIWNDARSLLIFQVLLIILSVVPIYLFTRERISHLAGLLMSSCYLLFWGIQHLLWFDFHELSFAVPLIAWALFFLQKKRWVVSTALILSLLLVKENLGLTVAAFGVYLFFLKQRKLGAALATVGAGWMLVMIGWIMPLLAGHASYNHWSYNALGSSPSKAAAHLVTHPWQLVTHLFDNTGKRKVLFTTFGSFLWLPALSPICLLILPSIFERMLSDNAAYWTIGYQYSATLAPILAFAAVDGLHRFGVPKKLSVVLLGLTVVGSLFFTAVTDQPVTHLNDRSFYDLSDAAVANEMVNLIPATASVAAQNQLVPHLSHRAEITQLGVTESRADYIAVNPAKLYSDWPLTKDQLRAMLNKKLESGYHPIFSQGDWLLLSRRAESSVPLSPAISSFLSEK